MTDIFVGMRKARILVPDNTPLSLLAMIGKQALDWLFTPGAEVWVTDMVREQALREPDPRRRPTRSASRRPRGVVRAQQAANSHSNHR